VPRLCSPVKSWAGQIRRGDVVSGPDIAPTAVINERDVAAVAVRVLTDHAYAGTKLLPAGELGVDGGDPPHAVRGEQRCEAVVVVHHLRVGELAPQRLDLDAVGDGLKVTHRFFSYLEGVVLTATTT
jgi:hypothetical protein